MNDACRTIEVRDGPSGKRMLGRQLAPRVTGRQAGSTCTSLLALSRSHPPEGRELRPPAHSLLHGDLCRSAEWSTCRSRPQPTTATLQDLPTQTACLDDELVTVDVTEATCQTVEHLDLIRHGCHSTTRSDHAPRRPTRLRPGRSLQTYAPWLNRRSAACAWAGLAIKSRNILIASK